MTDEDDGVAPDEGTHVRRPSSSVDAGSGPGAGSAALEATAPSSAGSGLGASGAPSAAGAPSSAGSGPGGVAWDDPWGTGVTSQQSLWEAPPAPTPPAGSWNDDTDPWRDGPPAPAVRERARRPAAGAGPDLLQTLVATGRHGDPQVPRSGEGTGEPRKRSGRAGRAGRSDRADGGSSPRQRPELSDAERAREICLRQLSVRPRTRVELAKAMRRAQIPDDVAAEVLERYGEVGIIDDTAFAKAWVTSRHHGKGLAKRALAGELRRKGVEQEAVGEALDELDPATEEATARELVARRLRVERRDKPDATLRRLVGMLARKGYPPGLAIRVVKDAMAEDAADPEYAAQIDVDALADAVDAMDGTDDS